MPRKKTIDISTLPEALQKDIISQLDKAESAETAKEAIRAKEAIEFYYEVKEELEGELLKKLSKQPSKDDKGKAITIVSPLAARAAGAIGWSGSKILKIIGNMPARKPDKDEGYIRAVSNIEKGKKRKLSDEAKAKAEDKKETAAEVKLAKAKAKREVKIKDDAAKAKAKEQRAAARTLFKSQESDRKKAANAKRKKVDTHKSAGAMATRSNYLSEKKYEDNRKNDPELREKKNAARRLRRENGNTN